MHSAGYVQRGIQQTIIVFLAFLLVSLLESSALFDEQYSISSLLTMRKHFSHALQVEFRHSAADLPIFVPPLSLPLGHKITGSQACQSC